MIPDKKMAAAGGFRNKKSEVSSCINMENTVKFLLSVLFFPGNTDRARKGADSICRLANGKEKCVGNKRRKKG